MQNEVGTKNISDFLLYLSSPPSDLRCRILAIFIPHDLLFSILIYLLHVLVSCHWVLEYLSIMYIHICCFLRARNSCDYNIHVSYISSYSSLLYFVFSLYFILFISFHFVYHSSYFIFMFQASKILR